MKRIGKKKRFIAINMGILLLASMLVYPIFAEDKIVVEENPKVTEKKSEIISNNEMSDVKDNTIHRFSTKQRAAVDQTFTANIYNNGKLELPCEFTVISLPENGNPGRVRVKNNNATTDPAIDQDTEGTIAFPDEIQDEEGNRYIITELGNYSFYKCTKITSTGLANNSTITSPGMWAFKGCTGLTSTGLANNNTITYLNGTFEGCTGLTSTGLATNTSITMLQGVDFRNCTKLTDTGLATNTTITRISYAFDGCTGLTSTGLEKNTTVTTINGTFRGCTGLTSTGLEKNTTIKDAGYATFKGCTNLNDELIFENTTLPYFNGDVFGETGINIYYLPEAANSEGAKSLNDENANSVNELAITDITIDTSPTKTSYIEGQDFDPTGLVLNVTYDKLGTKQRSYTDNTFTPYFSFDKTKLSYGDSNIVITYLDQSINQSITVNKKSVTNIEVKTVPIKVDYIEEQTFDLAGLVITVSYDNGTKEDITYNDSTKKDFIIDKTEAQVGDTGIIITYGGKSASQPITVKTKTVTGIKIKNIPTKVNYIEGQIFNPAGLVITTSYDNGKSEDTAYNDSTKNAFSFNKSEVQLGDTSVTIRYKGQSIEQNITVVEKVLTGIKVKKAPIKENYIEEERFDAKGLEITTIYNDEIEEIVVYNDSTKNDFSFDKDELKLGDTSISISYKGKTVNQAIKVKEKSITNVEIKTAPTKVSYIEREHFEPEGLVLTVYYDNGKNEDIVYNDSTKDDFSFDITILNYRDTEVVLTYKGKNVSQEVTVEAKPIAEIEIKETPKKIEYIEGTRFNPTGMNITVNYEDGDSAIIAYNEKTKIDFSFRTISRARLLMGEEMPILGLGNTTIEVSYRGEVATLLTIEVKEKEITEIKVVTPPTKVEYQEGEEISLEGLVLEVNYNNGSKEEVIYEESNKDMFTYNTNTLTIKDTKVEIEYKGNKVEIEIKVKAIPEIEVPKGIETAEKTPIEKEETVETGDTTMVIEMILMAGITLMGITKYGIKKSRK